MAAVVVERRTGEAQRAILKGLASHNAGILGRKQGWTKLAVTVRDDDGAIRGGAIGEVWIGWLFVKYVWIDPAFRGRGRAVMDALEAEARRAGAAEAYVDTFSFQAPGFYRKLGYREFGRLDGYPGEHARFWLTKSL